jgi:hypothetical protein
MGAVESRVRAAVLPCLFAPSPLTIIRSLLAGVVTANVHNSVIFLPS